MFEHYNEKNLYDRCGAIDVPIDFKRKIKYHGFTEIGGEKIPIISGMFQSGVKFTRAICLKTKFGYIPIDNITSYKDLLDLSKYCQDETEWIFQYDEKQVSQKDKENVKKLALTLGKHWKTK